MFVPKYTYSFLFGLVKTGELQKIFSAQKSSHLLEYSHLMLQSVGEEELTVKGVPPLEFLHQTYHLYLLEKRLKAREWNEIQSKSLQVSLFNIWAAGHKMIFTTSASAELTESKPSLPPSPGGKAPQEILQWSVVTLGDPPDLRQLQGAPDYPRLNKTHVKLPLIQMVKGQRSRLRSSFHSCTLNKTVWGKRIQGNNW